MIFELKNIGKVVVEETLECDLAISSEVFLQQFESHRHWLSSNTSLILKDAIDLKKKIQISQEENRELCSFFMTLNTDLMKKEMESMRICGAASFIPPNLDDKK